MSTIMMRYFLLIIFYYSLLFTNVFIVAKSHNIDDDDDEPNIYTERFMKNFDHIYLLGQKFTHQFFRPLYDESIANVGNLTGECRHSLQLMFTQPELEWASLSKLINQKKYHNNHVNYEKKN